MYAVKTLMVTLSGERKKTEEKQNLHKQLPITQAVLGGISVRPPHLLPLRLFIQQVEKDSFYL